MIKGTSLSGKKVLYYGDNSSLDKEIITAIESNGGCVCIYNEALLSGIEEGIKSLLLHSGPFDGFVFGKMHSDFRPLQYLKPNLVLEIMNDNIGLFLEAMRALKKVKGLRNGSSVVALSSISSFRAMKAKTVFCAAKAALDAAVRCLALELADKGIRINSIQKGYVDTDFEKGHIQNVVSINSNTEIKAPLGITKASEIANLVSFLLSDAMLTMTGTSIVIDGGYTV